MIYVLLINYVRLNSRVMNLETTFKEVISSLWMDGEMIYHFCKAIS